MKFIDWLIFLLQCSKVFSKRPDLVKQVNTSEDPDQAFEIYYSAFENEVIELLKIKIEELTQQTKEQEGVIEKQIADIEALNDLLDE